MTIAAGLVVVAPIFLAEPVLAADHTGTLPVFQSDFGGVGLLQTPTARMAPVGEFSFNFAKIDPYTNYAFSLQPLSWMQAGFRYTSIDNRLYGRAIAGDRSYLDKGVDVKFALVDERRFIPQIAMGFRDFGGTGLFSSEFFVANKRWYDLDFSFGIGWGYLGTRGDISNPLDILGDRYRQRQGSGNSGGGKFNLKNLYTGRPSLFGGIQYQTPFKPLTLQVEYEGNNYKNEPLNNNQVQDSPINVGARLRVNDNLTLSAAWERGDTAMLGATLSLNLATLAQPKPNDPPPVARGAGPAQTPHEWHGVVTQLAQNAGIQVSAIRKTQHSLIVEGSNTTYRDYPDAELRANRILENVASSNITSFKYRWQSRGFYLREDALPRTTSAHAPFFTSPAGVFADDDYRRGVTVYDESGAHVARSDETTLYKATPDRFSWNLRPALNQNYGGPDGYLYEILAELDAEFDTDRHGWFSGSLGYSLINNYDSFKYVAPSQLPRVRTNVNRYVDDTTLGIYNLQYTRTARLANNWFGMAYAGLLERMYGGVGGEVLYRPFNSPVAFGADVNWVRQRDFDTRFDFRNYETVEGHATAYIDTGIKHVLARLSVGRYLAKDYGTTIDFSRQFDSGVRLGAYATFTSAGNKYGEGSFDKGIYLVIPLDLFLTRSTRHSVGLAWSPLTRDGGAALARRYSLYSLTYDRSLNGYWDHFPDDSN